MLGIWAKMCVWELSSASKFVGSYQHVFFRHASGFVSLACSSSTERVGTDLVSFGHSSTSSNGVFAQVVLSTAPNGCVY